MKQDGLRRARMRKMRQKAPGSEDSKAAARDRPKAHLLQTEMAVSRAADVFTRATRKAGKRARDAGVAVTGRIAGKKVRISPDGKITEISAEDVRIRLLASG
jgi:hypothetical protein